MRRSGGFLALLFLGLASCAHHAGVAPDKADYMTRKVTDFYQYGPAQTSPPDKVPARTLVKLVRKDSGYYVIQLEDGRSGYVDEQDVRPAPPTALAVSEETVFPELVAPPLPEPDFAAPMDIVPAANQLKTSKPKTE